MRIVITGHKGQLGQALQRLLQQDEVLGIDLPEHDITDPRAVSQTIGAFRPDIVLHTAAVFPLTRTVITSKK